MVEFDEYSASNGPSVQKRLLNPCDHQSNRKDDNEDLWGGW